MPACRQQRPSSPARLRAHIFVVTDREFVTELLQPNVSSVTRGAVDESGMALAAKFPGLVKSPGLVVGPVDRGQRRQYRGLVGAVPLAPRATGWRSRQPVRPR